MKQKTTPIQHLRTVGHLEGISFLLLLGGAMPLKYLAGWPEAVQVVGWLHGMLFIVYCVVLNRAMEAAGWSRKQGALLVGAALVPCGPFLADRWLRDQDEELRHGGRAG